MYVDAPDSAADAIRSLVWVDRTGHEEIAAHPALIHTSACHAMARTLLLLSMIMASDTFRSGTSSERRSLR